MNRKLDVTIVGGGMITNDLILPSVYHLQREEVLGQINVCALNTQPLRALKESAEMRQAFPGRDFIPHPDLSAPPEQNFPDLFKEVIGGLGPRQAVIVALPDPLHYGAVMEALKAQQHVLCVKPLVLSYDHAEEVRDTAYDQGLFVGVEYHKRFDRRSLMARRQYQLGNFGEFRMGEAKMIEPYLYRHSNFQNWFTCENTDPFVYVGCHYVDLVYFITGLRPVEVSVAGVRDTFPNGKEGYMWATGRARFENGALRAGRKCGAENPPADDRRGGPQGNHRNACQQLYQRAGGGGGPDIDSGRRAARAYRIRRASPCSKALRRPALA